ncbi:MAG: ATP-binding protein, partial [Phormidesmis sp.]
PNDEPSAGSFFDFYRTLKRPVSRIQQAQSLSELCHVAVEEVKQVTGFDRVMVYQFDKDGSGSVIAESIEPNMTPYLGLHYPPTDVPKQAKHLYTINLLRLIPDVSYEPVRILASAPGQRPLDMSLAGLRSVSPLHTEYLSNMGAKATLTISLMRDHQLWGMLVCHHNCPRNLPYERRVFCEFLGRVIALEVAAKVNSQNADYQLQLKALQSRFVADLITQDSLKEGLTHNPERLIALTGSNGVAFCQKEEITLVGQTPERSQVSELVQWLTGQFGSENSYHTSKLSALYPPAAQFESRISGLMAIAISKVQQIYVLWFRPEVVQTVNWAGNPNKPLEIDEGEMRLSPRQSFAKWQEIVRQQSIPWLPCEIEAALALRRAVVGMVLQKAEEIDQLNLELTRRNSELDSFTYIASHDLKEPLRGIHNYASFLLEDYGEALDEGGTAKLDTLMRLTQRMQEMIESLLRYSRLGRADLVMRSVDVGELVCEVIEVVQMSRPQNVSFQIERSLPPVNGDYAQISELFMNLITNAIKYNDKAEKRIEIGYLAADEQAADEQAAHELNDSSKAAVPCPIFYVRDNGIGIREKHIDSVFRIFKRLHPATRFGGGTGAGLTITQKIVERHGGTIWIDSVYGEGSTFYFTLAADDT